MTEDDLVEIAILGIPPALYARVAARQDEILREFMHIAHSDPGSRGGIPNRLVELMEEVRATYGSTGDAVREQIYDALDEGRETIDIRMTVPPQVAEHARALDAILTEADEYCRAGALLALQPPPELVEFRSWYLGEVVRQVRGEAPRPWPEHREAAPAS